MFVCLRSSVRIDTSDFHQIFVHVTYGCGSVLLWQRGDMLRISGFVNDVIFAHKLIGCSTWPRGWGSEAHTCAASVLVHRNTRCRQRTLGTISCSQGLLGRSGRVEYLWYHVCMFAHNIPAYIATRKWRVLKVTSRWQHQGRSLRSMTALLQLRIAQCFIGLGTVIVSWMHSYFCIYWCCRILSRLLIFSCTVMN